MTLRLNIGCGPEPHPEWVNADVDGYPEWGTAYQHVPYGEPAPTPHAGQVLLLPHADDLPWESEVFAGIACHHVLQMLPYPRLVPWLAELHRITAPGGWLRLSVPDLLAAVRSLRMGDPDWFPIADDLEPSPGGKLCLYISQAGATRSVFTADWLCDLLGRAGWHAPQVTVPGYTPRAVPAWLRQLDSRPHESIFVEAYA